MPFSLTFSLAPGDEARLAVKSILTIIFIAIVTANTDIVIEWDRRVIKIIEYFNLGILIMRTLNTKYHLIHIKL